MHLSQNPLVQVSTRHSISLFCYGDWGILKGIKCITLEVEFVRV